MPINPKYAQVIEDAKKAGEKEFEKLPAIWLNNVGDAFSGTVTRVSDIRRVRNTHPQAPAGAMKDIQFVDLKDITLRKLDADKGEFVEEGMEKGTFAISKVGMFEAVIAALMESEQSDIPVGWTLKFRRGANDDKRHTFSAKLDNGVPF